jgi:hypothetical protein
MRTEYKEMKPKIAFVIVQNENGYKRYINGCYNPEIELTYSPEGAKHFDSYGEAEKELMDFSLQIATPPFIVEEHEWV